MSCNKWNLSASWIWFSKFQKEFDSINYMNFVLKLIAINFTWAQKSWWLYTRIPRRCDTQNRVEKVTKLVVCGFSQYGFRMTSQSAPVSRETPCAARDSRLMPNGLPSQCVPVGVMYFMSFILSNLPSMIARICCGLGGPPSSRCAALIFAWWSSCTSSRSPNGHVSSSCEMFITCAYYMEHTASKIKRPIIWLAPAFSLTLLNEHNLNGLDVKVTIPPLNSMDKCLPQSFFCAWERQAKFAVPSGPHQDVYDLHDVMMWYLSSDYIYLDMHLFCIPDIATNLYWYEFHPVMDLYTQDSCLTSCTLRISLNRKPTNLMSSSMSSEIRTLDLVHPRHAMLRLPPSIRYVICRCISAMPSFWEHSSHCMWASSVSSSARSSAASWRGSSLRRGQTSWGPKGLEQLRLWHEPGHSLAEPHVTPLASPRTRPQWTGFSWAPR